MAKKRTLSDRLNDAVEAILAHAKESHPVSDSEVASLAPLAEDLRWMPGESFKSRLKKELISKKRSELMKTAEKVTTAITPYLCVKNAANALEFYKRAFGAAEVYRIQEPDGTIGHAEIRIGDALLMLADEYPGHGFFSPQSIGGSPVTIHVYVEDADAVAAAAADAGATILSPVKDEFYGDRAGKIQDPFGHVWAIATHKEDLTADEIKRRAREMMKEKPAAPPPEEPGAEAFFFPRGLHRVATYLHVNGAASMIEFMKQAFFAEALEVHKMPDGLVAHAKVRIEDTVIEMGDAHGEHGAMPTAFHMFVSNADAIYQRALRAGASSLYEPANKPYGLREGGVTDPFGNRWYIATAIRSREEPQPAQVSKAAEGLRTVTPYLTVRRAAELVEFVKRSFGAVEISRATGSAGGMHCEVKIGDSMIMIGGMEDLVEESPAAIYLYVPDVDAAFERAVQTGATAVHGPKDQPYGDRTAWVKDPFGNTWYIATHIK